MWEIQLAGGQLQEAQAQAQEQEQETSNQYYQKRVCHTN